MSAGTAGTECEPGLVGAKCSKKVPAEMQNADGDKKRGAMCSDAPQETKEKESDPNPYTLCRTRPSHWDDNAPIAYS